MYCNCLRRLLHFQDLHRLTGGGTGVLAVEICADLVAEALADGRAADDDLDLVLQAALVDELDDLRISSIVVVSSDEQAITPQ